MNDFPFSADEISKYFRQFINANLKNKNDISEEFYY